MPDLAPVIALKLPPEELSAETTAYFDKCQEKLGLVPNVLRAYAFDEKKLRVFTEFYNELMLAESELSKLEREMIAVVVSAENRCHYCIVAHGATVRALSGDPHLGDTLSVNFRAAKLSAKHRAMLEFASRLTRTPADIDDASLKALRKAGFSEHAIWDIVAVAGFFNMTNRVASATKMKPNKEYYAMARPNP
ncbi:MAG: peroxidase-related enzyme [Pseudomonadota bacterium]